STSRRRSRCRRINSSSLLNLKRPHHLRAFLFAHITERMKLFVGLGNPGAKYAQNRHNIGFMALDEIARDHGFSPWRAKFQGQIADGRLGGQKVALLKPETFMNLSGQSVNAAMQFYKIDPSDVTVFHDELDLAPAKCRVKMGGGHAGHNGLRSIHQHIGAEYQRRSHGRLGPSGHNGSGCGICLPTILPRAVGWLDDVWRGCVDGAAGIWSCL
ncbi:UNVERIFIED_CONTAM: hypothetical protein GTU68_062461, partial [Idotea baltica]|nr:hypothetical protein [Idotea baltica]